MLPTEPDNFPWCDRCGRPVDSVERVYRVDIRALEFVVRCHGEEETAILGDADMANMVPETGLQFGVAFKKNKFLKDGDQ